MLISFSVGDRTPDSKATDGEIAQMRSVVGSFAWIARQCRPELCYYISKMQSVVGTALVKHLISCNKFLPCAMSTSNFGLTFKSDSFDWSDLILVTITDASWANGVLIIDEKMLPRRSQYGRISCFGSSELWYGDKGGVHIISWKSGLIKRRCRSTLRAET